MPKNWLKKVLPSGEEIKQHKRLQMFGEVLHDPNLWHLNRHSVARAFAIGLFCATLPIPFQMVVAAALAIFWHGNLLISVLLVWITNPLTMPIIFYSTYKFGTWLLNIPPVPDIQFAFTLEWFTTQFQQIILPLYFGSIVVGIIAGILGYYGVQLLWRIKVRMRWLQRKK